MMTTKAGKSNSLLHIFTGEGHTFTFQNVEITVDNESMLAFKYSSVSDGRSKEGNFSKHRIVGYTVTQ